MPVGAAAAAACSASAFQQHDLMGGDMQPLGLGFRNATSALDCCRQCAEVPSCAFFATAAGGPDDRGARGSLGPPHNCWLKTTAGTPVVRPGRTCGAAGPRKLPPAPAPPPPAFDACFPTPTKPWCD
jgi:hypothetical protein